MDRVNRSLLVASTLIAIPAALLMASLTIGSTPDLLLAVGESGDDTGAITQVVGKQPVTRQTRPGLFQVLSGAKTEGSRNHHHHNMPQEEPKGLLDGLFEGSNRSTNRSTSRPTRAAAVSRSQSSSDREAANWDGVPYHRATGTSVKMSSTPIRDPSPQTTSGSSRTASNSGPTRIIRGGSSRSVQATTASVRRPSEPTLARAPAQPLPAPQRELAPMRSSENSFSTSSSSRRSGRRSVDALDPSEVAAAAKAPAPAATETPSSETVDLVPKVVRKLEKAPPPKPATEIAKTTEEKPEPKSATDVEQKTALAAIGAPTPSQAAEPSRSAEPAKQPSAKQPAYTTPVDPATSPIPVAGIPTHPYAASTPSPSSASPTPAAPASHRAGPPSEAFGPGQIANVQPSHGQPQFNAASTPVGSGVVPNSDVASYRRPASADPYAYQSQPPTPRMTTYGQPVSNRSIPTSSARPAHDTAAIPIQPINGYGSQGIPANQGTDNFARSTYDSRNQMRNSAANASNSMPGGELQPGATAATSELPGIRVVTHGPSAIMIRQTSQYEIRVENRGSIDASGVMVRALVPDWAEVRGQNATRGDVDSQVQGSTERLVWTIDHLPAGASERMFVRLTAARSGTYDLDVDWTLVPQKSVAKVHVHEPRLNLTIEGPDQVVYGQSQTYKVRVLNPGDGTAPNVVFTLSPNSATPQTQRIGDIPPGKEAQFDVELTAQDLGDLKIHGLAAGDLELRAESAKTIRVAAARLEAVLTGPELKYQNTEAMYALQLQNTGAATSEKIVATLRLPTGVKYLGGIDEAVVQGNTLKWEITALAPGATRNYQFRSNMSTTGEHLFAFDCRGTAAGDATVSIATRVESIADLVLSVSDPTAPAPIGADVTYEIVIRNRGSKEATDVRAVAQFSHGIEPQRIEGQSGEVVTGQVLFDAIPRIGAGQEVRMRVIAQADRAGHHRFRTEVRSGDTVLVAEEATHYMSPKSDRVSRRSSDATKR